MPFVVVERSPSSLDAAEIERRCKAAWVAMDQSGDNSFKHTDVGGAVFTRGQNQSPTINLKFIYFDRGEEFDLRLRRAVISQFGLYDLIQTMPTGEWFVDPVWAVVRDADNEVELA